MSNSGVSPEILELEAEIKELADMIRGKRIRIKQIMKDCTHENRTHSKEWEVSRGIMERNTTCTICKHSWQEQRDIYESDGGKYASDEGDFPTPSLHHMTIS